MSNMKTTIFANQNFALPIIVNLLRINEFM